MKRILRSMLMAWALAGAAFTFPIRPHAQQLQVSSGAICLLRAEIDFSVGQIAIVAPADMEDTLTASGFATVPCSNSLSDWTAYRTNICEFAESGSATERDQFYESFQVTPEELCAWANDLING